jgi:hypothetical protein
MTREIISWASSELNLFYEAHLILSSHFFQLTQNPQMKLDRWVKKLFHMRQKAINGEPLA